jgi:hypothetical protein
MQLVQALTPVDRVRRSEFCEEMQLKMDEDGFVERLTSDKTTFHISGKVNRQCPYLGTVPPHAQTAPA